MEVVATPAARDTTRAPGLSTGAISASNSLMSWGLTTKITVSAVAAASAFSSMVTPYFSRSSICRSGRRSVATIRSGSQPARNRPESTVSPITPAPRMASRPLPEPVEGDSLDHRARPLTN